MTKMVTASEAKNRLGALLAEVQREQDAVIVANRGVPTAAIVPYAAFQQLQQFQVEQRRAAARATLQRLQREMSEQNQNLSAEQAEKLAQQVVSDAVAGLERTGKIRFEE